MSSAGFGWLDEDARRRHKLRNLVQTGLLLAGMIGLLGLCVWLLFGGEGALWALLGAGIGLAFGPRVPHDLVLRLYRAQELRPHRFPAGIEVLEALSRRAHLPRRPRLYYVPSATMNARAGRLLNGASPSPK